jgi:hypothetical protein
MMIKQVTWNESSLLMKIILRAHKYYNFLQLILKQKLFTIVIKNAEQAGLGLRVPDFY